MNKIFTSISYWLPPFLIMLIIFVLSNMPQLPAIGTGFTDLLAKKAGHMIGYGLLYLSWYRALMQRTDFQHRRSMLIAFTLTALYAVLDELHQSFVPGRLARITDVFIDLTGAYLASRLNLFQNSP